MLDNRNISTSIADSRSTGKASLVRARSVAITFGVTIALALVALAASSPARAAEDGAAVFKSNCVVCHGADGTGTPTGKSLKAPDLHSDAVQKLTDAEISAQIENGKNNMPPFKGVLNADQVKALVVYVRTFKKK
ncbi:MAG TPA: cytochrome c [Candidatus Acidoferrales bacterium]|jgi:mono/diheme cytochrome c family protein|nr:cytochrome c [Candidatus Acidoferrales bacterium]